MELSRALPHKICGRCQRLNVRISPACHACGTPLLIPVTRHPPGSVPPDAESLLPQPIWSQAGTRMVARVAPVVRDAPPTVGQVVEHRLRRPPVADETWQLALAFLTTAALLGFLVWLFGPPSLVKPGKSADSAVVLPDSPVRGRDVEPGREKP